MTSTKIEPSTQDVPRDELPGDWVDSAPGLAELDFSQFPTRVPTAQYTSTEQRDREHDLVWQKVWQVAGREADLAATGDWKEYRVFDQSYVIVRGKDGVLRGFVNACRHRGNLLCQGSGNTRRFVCQYHLWTYDLDGKLRGILREAEAGGHIDKSENGLIPVSVDTFGGFVFLNPDPDAEPLATFLGDEVRRHLEPYRLDTMTTVMDVKERINCNWKVVMDAFQEGYHINGIHPELLKVLEIDPATTRYQFFETHSVSMAPFEVAHAADKFGPEEQLAGIRQLPNTFPGTVAVLPRFEELVDEYRVDGRELTFPEGVTGRTILQHATRDTLTGMGLDVSRLTDAQMSDNHGWNLFPNFFMTVRAGECHIIMALPDPQGDPNWCVWHVASYMYLPEEFREEFRAAPVEVTEPGSFDYFLALQQDYVQMPRQQRGLRQSALDHLTLVKEEAVVAHFHAVLDRYLADEKGAQR